MNLFGNLVKYLFCLIILCCIFFSCTVVKNPPAGKPFIYDNKIKVTGNISKDEKKKLTNDLATYWDDSLYAHKVQQFGVRYVLRNPPVFDTVNIARTRVFMTGYLNSQGYYTPSFKNIDSCYSIDTVTVKGEQQIRTTIALNIDPGKPTIIDSLSYNLKDNFLNALAIRTSGNSSIKPGKTPFSKQAVASELDRLMTIYRRRGYFLLTRDNLVAEIDTSLISPELLALDPFEQARIIAEAAQKKKENPACNIVIKKRENPDSTQAQNDTIFFKQYFIGNIYYYPETKRYDVPDSLIQNMASFKQDRHNYSTMLYNKGLFKFRVLREHTYQRRGRPYNEDQFYKTLNNLNQIGAWSRVDYRTVVHNDSVDFHYFLEPAARETISFNLEASHSTGDFLSTSNLIGLAFNVSYLNRNILRNALQSNTTLSNGVEFGFNQGTSFLQTVQSSITQSFSIPRLIGMRKKMGRVDAARTNLILNAAYYDRKDFYRLRSLVGSWGYQFKLRNMFVQFKAPNVELYSLDTLHLLADAFQTNPFLRTSFNTGTVIGGQGSIIWTLPGRLKRVTNYYRIGAEVSTNFWVKSWRDEIYHYFKLEGEYRKLISYPKTAWAFRAFVGVGDNVGKSKRFGNTLPFFKQYIAGGPNSMRAWGLRLLGLGSSVVRDTAALFRDRYGDMQIETNAEYRFTLAQFSSVKIGSALFVDMGNIWNIHKNDSLPNSEFDVSRLWQDWAIGVGTGLRFDFSYFLIRVDFGIKLKDPARYEENNGWLNIADFTWRNYLYSEKNPTTHTYTPAPRNNYAIQLGIGMPF